MDDVKEKMKTLKRSFSKRRKSLSQMLSEKSKEVGEEVEKGASNIKQIMKTQIEARKRRGSLFGSKIGSTIGSQIENQIKARLQSNRTPKTTEVVEDSLTSLKESKNGTGTFFFFGDSGTPNLTLHNLIKQMKKDYDNSEAPQAIVLLGDNFYPVRYRLVFNYF